MREEREADEGRENWRFILLHRCIDLGMAIQIDIESRCGRDMDDGRWWHGWRQGQRMSRARNGDWGAWLGRSRGGHTGTGER